MKISSGMREKLTRALFISAGVVSAILFALHGQGEVLPPLALGGLLGACLAGGLSAGANEE